ncbi:hypothetical protein L3i22_011060 [Actinoplanes sp. L3-i22]|nr:hypothetical protein L3i22_011060 [Actinoplanes sp. L3-i22]
MGGYPQGIHMILAISGIMGSGGNPQGGWALSGGLALSNRGTVQRGALSSGRLRRPSTPTPGLPGTGRTPQMKTAERDRSWDPFPPGGSPRASEAMPRVSL